MEVGTPDVADQQRVATEQEPRLVGPTPPVRDRIGVMGRRMSRCGDRPYDRVPELDDLAVDEPDMLEVDARVDWQISGRAGARDEGGQTRDVIGLHVRLEH